MDDEVKQNPVLDDSDEAFRIRRSSPARNAVLTLLGIALLGGGGYAAWRHFRANPSGNPAALSDAGRPQETGDGGGTDAGTDEEAESSSGAPVDVAQGDTLLRELAKKISGSPAVAGWFDGGDGVRSLAAAVNLMSEGNSPRAALRFIPFTGSFEVVRRADGLHATPGSYARYDDITEGVTKINPDLAGHAYRQLEHFFSAAFREVAKPGTKWRSTFRRTLAELSRTPVPNMDPVLVRRGLIYVYVDAPLEALTPAQKHLLRLGPSNARAVQKWLTRFEQALGEPKPAPAAR